jgi:hypothetical protein
VARYLKKLRNGIYLAQSPFMGDSSEICDLKDATPSIVPCPISVARGIRKENHKS